MSKIIENTEKLMKGCMTFAHTSTDGELLFCGINYEDIGLILCSKCQYHQKERIQALEDVKELINEENKYIGEKVLQLNPPNPHANHLFDLFYRLLMSEIEKALEMLRK